MNVERQTLVTELPDMSLTSNQPVDGDRDSLVDDDNQSDLPVLKRRSHILLFEALFGITGPEICCEPVGDDGFFISGKKPARFRIFRKIKRRCDRQQDRDKLLQDEHPGLVSHAQTSFIRVKHHLHPSNPPTPSILSMR
jgi:hypothetical protein